MFVLRTKAPGERAFRLCGISAAMQGVADEIRQRQVGLFSWCDPAYGATMANGAEATTIG